MLQRWARAGAKDDGRHGPRTKPGNALSPDERRDVLTIMNAPEHCELSPKQIVPTLADRGCYVASESTMYRILRAEGLLAHRGKAQPPSKQPVLRHHVATGPNQVWSWDITFLRRTVKGSFFYLYMVEDVWSRKIVAWEVYPTEAPLVASAMITRACEETRIDVTGLVLHSDNGDIMRGSLLHATLQRLGVVPSFSRPSVSDDNAYSELTFKTMKYRPEYPRAPFDTLEQASAWVAWFVRWYNVEHHHSAIRFVTPEQRHHGAEVEILARRARLYEAARQRHPERWSGATRDWNAIGEVHLNQHADAEQRAA